MKIFLFILGISVLFVSCRKKELRDVETTETAGAQHCSNFVKDADELGVDCGGADCDPCQQDTLPCNIPDNKVRCLEASTVTTESLINQSHGYLGNNYVFRAYTGDGDSLILTFDDIPDVTQTYSGVANSFDISSTEVLVEYFQPYPLKDWIGSGAVYVNFIDGAYKIGSCDYDFHEYGQPSFSIEQYFSITFY